MIKKAWLYLFDLIAKYDIQKNQIANWIAIMVNCKFINFEVYPIQMKSTKYINKYFERPPSQVKFYPIMQHSQKNESNSIALD